MALEKERAHFERIRDQLLAQHEGKHALIHGDKLLGVFDTRELAYEHAVKTLGNVPVLIELIRRGDRDVDVAPALMFGLIHGSA